MLSGAAGVATAIVALVPSCESPPKLRATLKTDSAIPNVTLGDYLNRVKGPTTDYSPQALRALGSFVSLNVDTVGLAGRDSELQWSLFAARGSRVFDDRWIGQVATTIRPRAVEEHRIAYVWIPLPPLRGTFFARIELVYRDEPLASTIRTRFAGARSPTPGLLLLR